MKISEIITDKYKLRIEPNVYYDLLADVREAEEEQEHCEDCVSRQAVIDAIKNYASMLWEKYHEPFPESTIMEMIQELPSVNPQEPICPSAGIDCEDCPAYEDAISRKAALDAIEDDARCGVYSHFASYDDAQAFKNYIKDLPSVSSSEKPKSEWEHDHEILKAYSDGANEVLDKIRLDIAQEIISRNSDIYDWEARWQNMGLRIALKVIDKYKAEGSGE